MEMATKEGLLQEQQVRRLARADVRHPDTTERLICVSESLAAGSYAKVKASD